ncbi:hypothetical protein EVA_22622 [gut metagenome]|uniref:Uncharacterized protein n=1 Tax=gut metagenome TaxID=749906 RepID=J9F303_9ZZZZ
MFHREKRGRHFPNGWSLTDRKPWHQKRTHKRIHS